MENQLGHGYGVSPLIWCEERVFGDGAGSELICGAGTSISQAMENEEEQRAYKLGGKHKCSYNELELIIQTLEQVHPLKISEAIESPAGNEVDERLRKSTLKFDVRFTSGETVVLYVLLVFSTPLAELDLETRQTIYKWIPVTRSKCRRRPGKLPCTGPVLRGLQRFGVLKNPRNLYIAIDEASTHVSQTFRFLFSVFDESCSRLLGTSVSSPLRVLANNDTPLGAAVLSVHCSIGAARPDENSIQDLDLHSYATAGFCSHIIDKPLQEVTNTKFKRESQQQKSCKIHEQVPKPPAFDPFQCLKNVFTPLQIDYLQRQNPAFLYNFVKYSRELYTSFCREHSDHITRPKVKRPRAPNTLDHKNQTRKMINYR